MLVIVIGTGGMLWRRNHQPLRARSISLVLLCGVGTLATQLVRVAVSEFVTAPKMPCDVAFMATMVRTVPPLRRRLRLVPLHPLCAAAAVCGAAACCRACCRGSVPVGLLPQSPHAPVVAGWRRKCCASHPHFDSFLRACATWQLFPIFAGAPMVLRIMRLYHMYKVQRRKLGYESGGDRQSFLRLQKALRQETRWTSPLILNLVFVVTSLPSVIAMVRR